MDQWLSSRNNVFFGSGDGYVYAVSADKGRLKWRKRTGAGVEAVVLAGESLLAASLDNFAYLLDLEGSMLWKKQLPGRISAQPLTVEEAALFTPLSSSAGVVLALTGRKTSEFTSHWRGADEFSITDHRRRRSHSHNRTRAASLCATHRHHIKVKPGLITVLRI